MAAKKVTLDSLAALISKQTKSADRKFAALAGDIADIKATMAAKDHLANVATKGDIAALGEQVTNIERELRGIRRDLNDLTEKVENVIGFRKEIDHALERIAAIEKHLGLDKKIVA